MSYQQRSKPPGSLLIFLGLILVSCGLLLVTQHRVYAQDGDTPPAEYIGSKECAACHKTVYQNYMTGGHALALQDVSKSKTAIKADFTTGEKERTVTFPGDAGTRPFKPEDVTYVIGSGRYVERYLYKIASGKYAVFPAEWNIEKKVWEPYVRGGNTSQWPDDPAYDWTTNCAGCHTTGLDTETGKWKDIGVRCEACHGPGSNHVELAGNASDPATDQELQDIHAAISLSPDPQVCGQCHSQGVEPDNKLPYPVKFRPGMNLLDKTIFSLVPADSPDHWWQTGHAKQPNMQFNEWQKSAHAKSLTTLQENKDAAPACLECHSGDFTFNKRLIAAQDKGIISGVSTDPLTVQSAKYSVDCLTCHDPHINTTKQQVAFDIATGDSNALCISCHRATDVTPSLHHPAKEMFEGQPLVAGIAGIPSAHFADPKGPRCQTCHMPQVPISTVTNASHSFQVILPGKADGKLPDSCTTCHTDLKPDDLQSLIDATQDTVRTRLSVALARLATIAKPTAGNATYDKYNQIVLALNFVQNEGSLGVHNYPYTDALLTASERTLAELSVPGSVIEPTEAPVPTARAAVPPAASNTEYVSVPTGIRPITVVVGGLAVLVLLIGAVVFFRKSGHREA